MFGGVAGFSLLLMWPSMIPFTVGALGCALLLGLGNGAVFKLVPERFPRDTGTVTGLVGALGGLGGFFPPLLLGVFHDTIGVLWPGFVLLSLTAIGLRAANQRLFHPAETSWRSSLPAAARQSVDRIGAGVWGAAITALLAAAIVVGSRNLADFDAALVGYTFATLFATFGITYRYAMCIFIGRQRGFILAARLADVPVARFPSAVSNVARLWQRAVTDVAGEPLHLQAHRSSRGIAHWLIMWGCVLAPAITFPLVWGWGAL